MTKFTIRPSCLYHPLTVVFLDDNESFLDAIKLGSDKSALIRTFSDPTEALAAINSEEENIINNISNVYSDVDTDDPNKKVVDIDIGSIRNSIYDASRFNHIGVVVVDYKMPEMTGTDFCRSIKDKHIYKVMLTAEAALNTAIEAFNEGVINKFLLKQNDDLQAHLACVISELEEKYFHDISKPILRALDNNLSEMLKSDVFIELFNSVFRDSNAVEYYLLDTSGSYLFLDKEGYPTWLIIRSEHDFNVQLETLSGLDAEEKLINDLTSREKLLFMLSEEEYQEPVGEWNNSLFEAKELTSPLWYSIKKGPIKTAVDWKQIKAYQGSK